MQRTIFDFVNRADHAKIRDPRKLGTRRHNLEVGGLTGRVVSGHVQWPRFRARPKTARALHFGVMNTRPTRPAASTIGGCDD